MKIALIREKVNRYGGAEKNVWFLANGLLGKGHDVHVFAAAWDNEIPGVTYHRVEYFRGISFLKPLFFALKCKELVDREKFDVVQSFDRTFCQDVYRAGDGCHIEWMRRLGRERGLFGKILIRLNPKNMVQLYLEKKLLRDPRLKRVITNSEMVKNEIVRNYGLPSGKIRVIYNGVEAFHEALSPDAKQTLRKAYGFVEEDLLILFVGSNFERKGLKYLIAGIAGLPGAKVIVVGRGDEHAYKTIAQSCGVADRISFFGVQKDLKDFYQMSDIFVLPTLYDPFSNVTLEAMNCGLPVITTPDNGAAEVILEGKSGYVVTTGGLADKMRLLADRGLRDTLGSHALSAVTEYSFERVLSGTIDLYEEIGNTQDKEVY